MVNDYKLASLQYPLSATSYARLHTTLAMPPTDDVPGATGSAQLNGHDCLLLGTFQCQAKLLLLSSIASRQPAPTRCSLFTPRAGAHGH